MSDFVTFLLIISALNKVQMSFARVKEGTIAEKEERLYYFNQHVVEPIEGKHTDQVDIICKKIAYEYRNFICADKDAARQIRTCIKVSRMLQTIEEGEMTLFVSECIDKCEETSCVKRNIVFKDGRFPTAKNVQMFHCPARKNYPKNTTSRNFYIMSGHRTGDIFVFLDSVVDKYLNRLENSVKLWNHVDLH